MTKNKIKISCEIDKGLLDRKKRKTEESICIIQNNIIDCKRNGEPISQIILLEKKLSKTKGKILMMNYFYHLLEISNYKRLKNKGGKNE